MCGCLVNPSSENLFLKIYSFPRSGRFPFDATLEMP